MIPITKAQKNQILQFLKIVRKYILEKPIQERGIFDGASGISLFCFHYHLFQPTDNDIYDKGLELLTIEASDIKSSISNNFAFTDLKWFIWIVSFLNKEGLIEADLSDYDSLKPLLFDQYQKYLDSGNYDLLYGFIGLSKVLYFFSDEDRFLELNKNFFLETAQLDDLFAKWPSLFIEKENVFNLGLAHGMPGIILYLIKLYELNPNDGSVFRNLALKSCNYILTKKQDYTLEGSYFPNNITDDNSKAQVSRLAWCYGDLGVGYCLWKTGTIFEDKDLSTFGLEVLLSCTQRRDQNSTKILDLSVCHGSSGLMLFFKRLHDEIGCDEFKLATQYWLAYTLNNISNANDITSIKAWRGKDDKYIFEKGLLMGVTGIGLVLLEMLEDKKYNWSDWLLL